MNQDDIQNDNDGALAHQQEQEQQQWLAQNHIQSANTQRNTNMTINNDMSFDQLVPKNSNYLSKEDVGEDGVILTIKGFKEEQIEGDDGLENKIVMYFHENYKPMIINRTNSQLIQIATSARTTGEAVGKEIVVYCDPTVGFGGKITGGIRIKKMPGAPKQAKSSNPQDLTDIDSDVPF